MEFDFFDSSGCSFPKPRVPVLPPLTRHSLKKKLPDKQGARWQLEGAFMPLRKAVGARHYARGRYALYEAYRLAGIGESGALFAPSYHCSTMLDPALRLKAEIDFYPLNADLSPQLEAISAKLRAQTRPIKALLATHYFGFPHEFAPLAALCELYGVTLIEDCSHTLFAPTEVSARSTQNAVGETGRFGIASPYKFYPSEDGGLLWFNDESGHAAAPQHAPAAVAELRALRSSFQRNRTKHKKNRWDTTPKSLAIRFQFFTNLLRKASRAWPLPSGFSVTPTSPALHQRAGKTTGTGWMPSLA
jgi:perosamine synthetase